jgi:hypothetical protein
MMQHFTCRSANDRHFRTDLGASISDMSFFDRQWAQRKSEFVAPF